MKHNLKRIFASGWVNFKRNSYISLAVTGVMALVLMLLLGLISFDDFSLDKFFKLSSENTIRLSRFYTSSMIFDRLVRI